jgi:hypothetical protein
VQTAFRPQPLVQPVAQPQCTTVCSQLCGKVKDGASV